MQQQESVPSYEQQWTFKPIYWVLWRQDQMTVEINDVCDSSFSEFSTVSEDDIHKVIKESAIKSSDLDSLPASLFNECNEELLPAISDIINCSLMSGVVPSELKTSRIIPLLKKPSLNMDCLQNYRPISNLPLLAKVLEQVVTKQL